MIKTQDPKYVISDEGYICNAVTGRPIPRDEPVFILRAQDELASQTLAYYLTMVATETHKDAVKHRIDDFNRFRRENPSAMKAPDTVYPYPDPKAL